MPETVQIYTLFITAPGDAMEMVRNPVLFITQEWNRIQGESIKTRVEVRDWASHSFPEYGKRPQASINKRVLNKSDFVLAAYWTRFGTAAGMAPPGTEEEIIRANKRKLPVMLYFVDKPVRPSELNQAQYRRVKNFRKAHVTKDSIKHLFRKKTLSGNSEFICRI